MERSGLRGFWDSSVGKKIVMGGTGLILVAFVVGHMAGNLQFFAGSARFDAYSNLLQVDLIELTWLMRVTLLAAVVLHIVAAYQLTMRSRAARPEDYARRDPQIDRKSTRLNSSHANISYAV